MPHELLAHPRECQTGECVFTEVKPILWTVHFIQFVWRDNHSILSMRKQSFPDKKGDDRMIDRVSVALKNMPTNGNLTFLSHITDLRYPGSRGRDRRKPSWTGLHVKRCVGSVVITAPRRICLSRRARAKRAAAGGGSRQTGLSAYRTA